MSFATGMAVGMAIHASQAAHTGAGVAAGAGVGLTAGSALVLGIGIPVAVVAGAYAGHQVAQNPKAVSAIKMVAAAALLSPFFAAEDLLRAAGAPISEKGILYNDEGKSIWQIWNEAAPQ